MTPVRLAAAALAAALFLTPTSAVGKEKKTDEEKQADKEKKRDEKNLSRYEKLKEFSVNKYKTDPEFRDDVDHAYAVTMRKHSSEAFDNNRYQRSQLVAIREDTWREHDRLYDNLLVQDHINRIGQRLVPQGSDKLYAFRIVPNAIPLANSLSTGTIYVSTGMVSLLESEAQLAYVLAHELAHVHLDHWKEKVMLDVGEEEYNEAQGRKAGRLALIGAMAGAGLAGGFGRSGNAAVSGAMLGGLAGYGVGTLMNREIKHGEWDKVQEDQADEFAFKAVLGSTYDVREVPKLYMALDGAAVKDTRVQLGFLGERRRVKQRLEQAENLIANAYKAEIDAKAKSGFVSSSAEHRNLMAELKRDNGILAYYSDMFAMARSNLSEAAAIRDNDPAVHYFYGKTLKLVGRTDEDARLAKESFFKATKADSRGQNYGSNLHLAMMMARERGVDPKQVAAELDTYVTGFVRWQVEHGSMVAYPPNLSSIHEYMSMYGGDPRWKPKVPDLAEYERYRRISDFVPSREPEREPVVQRVADTPRESTVEKVIDKSRAVDTPALPAVVPVRKPGQRAK